MGRPLRTLVLVKNANIDNVHGIADPHVDLLISVGVMDVNALHNAPRSPAAAVPAVPAVPHGKLDFGSRTGHCVPHLGTMAEPRRAQKWLCENSSNSSRLDSEQTYANDKIMWVETWAPLRAAPATGYRVHGQGEAGRGGTSVRQG